jgi:hypothetical protein
VSTTEEQEVKIAEWRRDVDAAIAQDDPTVLRSEVIWVAMYHPDPVYAEALCSQLSSHVNNEVRGNAVLGFGHVARVHGVLNRDLVQPIILAALSETDRHVRGHAICAVQDTSHFLGWTFPQWDSETESFIPASAPQLAS